MRSSPSNFSVQARLKPLSAELQNEIASSIDWAKEHVVSFAFTGESVSVSSSLIFSLLKRRVVFSSKSSVVVLSDCPSSLKGACRCVTALRVRLLS